MRQTFSKANDHKIRNASIDVFSVIKSNKSLIISLFFVSLVATSLFGFTLGGFTPNESYASSAHAGDITDFEEKIINQDLNCLEIEKFDTLRRNEELEAENKKIEAESNTLEEKILGALMSNLDDKLLSNRSSSVSSFVEEARNLITLNAKIDNFKQSGDYDLIDLSLYEDTVKGRLSRIPTLKPIPGFFPGYGWRYHPIYGYYEFHPAADQSAPYGTNIRAAGAGTVVASAFDWSRGYYVIINHGNGFTTTYMHNSVNYVSYGQVVSKGEIIGQVGATGIATGSHLHFEVAYNGVPFNPQQILIQ